MTKIRKVSLVFITLCGFMNTLQEAGCALCLFLSNCKTLINIFYIYFGTQAVQATGHNRLYLHSKSRHLGNIENGFCFFRLGMICGKSAINRFFGFERLEQTISIQPTGLFLLNSLLSIWPHSVQHGMPFMAINSSLPTL